MKLLFFSIEKYFVNFYDYLKLRASLIIRILKKARNLIAITVKFLASTFVIAL
jgi:hypothetical protein